MLWTKENLPLNLQQKPEHVLTKSLSVANSLLSKGCTTEEAIFACTQAIKRIEQESRPAVEPRKIPSHVQAVIQKKTEIALPKKILPKNTLDNSDRNLIKAEFNSNQELVLEFDTGEKLTTKSIQVADQIAQYLTVVAGFNPNLSSPTEGQVISYDSSTGTWINRTISGTTEGEDVLSKRTDIVGETQIYQAEASAGTLNSAPNWRIKLITLSPDGDSSTTWANGNSNYDKVWNDRLTYTYS